MPVLGGGNYLKAEFVKTGETLVLNNGGEFLESTYKYPALKMNGEPHPMAGLNRKDLVFKVTAGGQKYDFRMNITNQNALKEKWGRNTDDWSGKMAKIEIIKVSVSGKMQNSILLTPIGDASAVEHDAGSEEGPADITWEN